MGTNRHGCRRQAWIDAMRVGADYPDAIWILNPYDGYINRTFALKIGAATWFCKEEHDHDQPRLSPLRFD
jgi:hypothetical protein